MTRTANDDRSDTLNPNNDAYWADQANRFGDDDESDDSAPAEKKKRAPVPDTRFGPDPHPILGKRSNRLPGLSRDLKDQPWIELVVPWTERVALAFATEASEKRDRLLAIEELMLVARWLCEEARSVIVRQGRSCVLETSEDGQQITLACSEKHILSIEASAKYEVVFLKQASRRDGTDRAFLFEALRWYFARKDVRGMDREIESRFRDSKPTTAEEEKIWEDEKIRSKEVVYRRSGYHEHPADPSFEIVEAIRKLA